MAKFFKIVKLEHIDYVMSSLRELGFTMRVFPYRERGLNQTHYRKIEIINEGRSELEKMRRSRALHNSGLLKYFVR